MLGGLAIVGSLAYGWAWAASDTGAWQRHGPSIALAAGLSWIVFGAAIGIVTRFRPDLWSWADLCLRVMGIGITPLIVAASLVLAGFTDGALHLGLLVVSNLLMLALFARRAIRLGMPVAWAFLLWVLVLNGVFSLLLMVLP